jgi:hypothetical protein
MLRRVASLTIAFILGMLLQSPARDAQAGSIKGASLQPMLEVLEKSNLSGSLEFTGNCDGVLPPDLPPLRTITGRGGSALQSLREILRDDHPIRVEQDQTGKIRMVENDIPTDLLNLKIRHISFDGTYRSGPESGVYTPNQALYVILHVPELAAFIKTHDIEILATDSGISGGAGQLPPDSPHISGSLDDVTLSQALDRVLETFPGIWVYQNCPRKQSYSKLSPWDNRERAVYFRFFYLRKFGARVFVEG